MTTAGVLLRPRSTFLRLAESPRLLAGFLTVLASGVLSGALGVLATALAGGGWAGIAVSASLPPLFLAYWAVEGWLVDAGAGMLGRQGRRRDFLAVSGHAFVAWIAYGLLQVLEGAALHAGGLGPTLASALGWLALPLVAWFVALSVLAIMAVYGTTPLNALALALLPYAALMAALLVLGVLLGTLHAANVL